MAKEKEINCKQHNGKFIPNRNFRTGIIVSRICPECTRKTKKVLMDLSKDKSNKFLGYKYHTNKTKKKKSPKAKARDNADKWFSLYIRIQYSDRIINGEVFCKCIITGKIYNANKVDNGHYCSRDYKSTRYFDDNCRPQNRSSNRYRGEADHYKFGENLAKEIGQERLDYVEKLKDTLGEDNEIYYLSVAKIYRKKVNALVKKHDIIKWW